MLPSGLPDQVDDNEPLARFLISSGQYNSTQAKRSAFMPDARFEKSVFRVLGLQDTEIETISANQVSGAKGVAVFPAKVVRSIALDVLAKEPPPRHANIVKWQVGPDPELAKARHIEQANEIARSATLTLFKAPTL